MTRQRLETCLNERPIDDAIEVLALLASRPLNHRRSAEIVNLRLLEPHVLVSYFTGPYDSLSDSHDFRVTERVVEELLRSDFVAAKFVPPAIIPDETRLRITDAGGDALWRAYDEIVRNQVDPVREARIVQRIKNAALQTELDAYRSRTRAR